MSRGGYIAIGIVVVLALLALAFSGGGGSEDTQSKKDYEAKKAEHEVLRARERILLKLARGTRFTCNDTTYTIGAQGVVLSNSMQLPLYRATLNDGTRTPRVLFVQVYNMGYTGIWIATRINFRGAIPNIEDPQDVTWQGRTFTPGLWGTTYYTWGDRRGICWYLKYSATDTPRTDYGSRLKGDELYFEKLGDGKWRVYFRTEYQIRDIAIVA